MHLFRTATAALAALVLTTLITGCDKDEEAEVVVGEVDVDTGGNGGNGGGGGGGNTSFPITGHGVFSCNMTSGPYLFSEDDPDREMTYGNYDFQDPTRRSFECRFFDSTEYETQAAVSLRNLEYSGADPTDEAFYAFFHTGEYPIADLLMEGLEASNGAVIYMWKPEWSAPRSSDLVINQPADAHFTVTDVEPINDGSGVAKVKVRATFKCEISTGTGGLTLSDGVFVGIFGKTD